MRVQLKVGLMVLGAIVLAGRAADADEPVEAATIVKRASTELATYQDTDHVTIFTPTIAGGLESPTAGWSVKGRYLVDVVSAASVDIVSTASRRWNEVRHAAGVDAAYKPKTLGIAGGASMSSEPDYLALAAGASVSQDFNEKNLTLLVGYGYGHDTIGRTGTPFSVFSHALDRHSFNAGLTAVLDASTVLGVGADVVIERGDTSKPYRYIPLFSPEAAGSIPRGASVDTVTQLRLPERPLEQLPTSRDRFALTGRLARRFARSTLRLEERLYDDSWSLKASTTDARYIVNLGERWSVWPHARFHVQSPVDFWQRAYVLKPGLDFPALRTGDRELGPLFNVTGGGGVHWYVGSAAQPRAWALGAQLNFTWTSFLDDLYTKGRLSALGAFTVEAEL